MTRRVSLAGRVVLVTGASSGIGLAVATEAATDGAHVVLVARDLVTLHAAGAACERAGAATVEVHAADIADDPAIARVVADVVATHGRLDVVVNSAGVVAYGRTEDVPPEVFEGVVRTNLLGSATVARHVVPVLRRQDEGTLVLVGSVIGHIAVPTMSAYVVSKWGVRALARQLRIENRDRPGMHVAYVAPGGVDTPIYQQAATVVGTEGRPPPPVASARRTGRQVLARVGRSHARPQLALTNEVIRLGFTAFPRLYDAIIATSFRLGATDLDRPTPPTDGNVLASRPERNALHGDQGSALVGILRNVRTSVRTGRRPESGR